MTTSTRTHLTIRLTGRPPVTIEMEAWPIIALATAARGPASTLIALAIHRSDGQIALRSFCRTRASIHVRQHQDGRAIVYGSYTYESFWKGESSFSAHHGQMVPPNWDLIPAIEAVAQQLEDARQANGAADHFMGDDNDGLFPSLAAQCITDRIKTKKQVAARKP